ncbi:fungal-specific transcription factor domain protein [Xylogone sp. PMI_703]|nr:fungal-specific transcription factor domain protein [Xylogone sp. PMI_703]
MHSSDSPSSDIAARACARCRKDKRRCDKALPKCALCSRMGRVCDYSEPPVIEADDTLELRNRIQDLEEMVSRLSNRTPSTSSSYEIGVTSVTFRLSQPLPPYSQLAFLDSSLLEHVPFETSRVELPIPEEITNALGDWTRMSRIAATYFESIHVWMPIISKYRLSRLLEKAQQELRPEQALLLLCMKLVQEVPNPENVEVSLIYGMAKQFSLRLEMSSCSSLQFLQSNLLIAVFELGHAILPAAYTSIGSCARLATALGIHDKNAPQLLPKPRGWVEWEERQRVWWLIVILERYVCIGSSRRPLCTKDPSADTSIPVDDDTWDRGEMVPPQRVFVSTPTNVPVGSFARLAQASNLLGHVIRHCDDQTSDVAFIVGDMTLLHQTIGSLLELLGAGSTRESCSAAAVCLSALMKLCSHHSCDSFSGDGKHTDPELTSLIQLCTQQALQVTRDTCLHILQLAPLLQQEISNSGTQSISPLVINCIYQTIVSLTVMGEEVGDGDCIMRIGECKRLLQTIDTRWKAAGTYLEIIRAVESHMESDNM